MSRTSYWEVLVAGTLLSLCISTTVAKRSGALVGLDRRQAPWREVVLKCWVVGVRGFENRSLEEQSTRKGCENELCLDRILKLRLYHAMLHQGMK